MNDEILKLAKECGIAYYSTPENTDEMHGTARQIEAFAERLLSDLSNEIRDLLDGYALLLRENAQLKKQFLPEHCMCDECKDGAIHQSDCAVHNEPAYPKGVCTCGAKETSAELRALEKKP